MVTNNKRRALFMAQGVRT